jgi:tRNA 2-thiouridine synthesizing protein A
VTEGAPARVVDALGTWCPVPIHLVARAADRSAPGDLLELLADDPLVTIDLPAWCHSSGHELVELRRDGDDYRGRVRVTGRRPTGEARR